MLLRNKKCERKRERERENRTEFNFFHTQIKYLFRNFKCIFLSFFLFSISVIFTQSQSLIALR